MSDLFKTLSSSFPRFAVAWILPAVVTLSVFVAFVYPPLKDTAVMAPVRTVTDRGALQVGLVFAFAAVVVGLLFALTALGWVRLLEGYGWPRALSRRMVARQRRRLLAMERRLAKLPQRAGNEQALLQERIRLYPTDRRDILPTRLGNAYLAAETYGRNTFELDLQTLNFELFSVASERMQRDSDEAFGSVDFFLAFFGQFVVLAAVSLGTAAGTGSRTCFVVALALIGLARLAYESAIKNMVDFGYAMQALVHTGRAPLAKSLGYALPPTLRQERELWRAWSGAVHYRDQRWLTAVDEYRLPPEAG